MSGIIHLTLLRLREASSIIMFVVALFMGYLFCDMETLASQLSADSLLSHLIADNTGNLPILAGTSVAFGITMVLVAFTGAVEIPRDISSGRIVILLSKPVHRWEYLFGKFIGIFLHSLIFFSGMMLALILFHYLCTNEWYAFMLIARQFSLVLAFIPFVAIIVTLSCFIGDIASIIVTAIYLLFSMLFNFVPILLAMLPEQFAGNVENSVIVLYYFFPNYVYYFVDYKFGGLVFFALILYSISTALIFLSIAICHLNNTDLSRRQ